jgi:hypothetical protein
MGERLRGGRGREGTVAKVFKKRKGISHSASAAIRVIYLPSVTLALA